MFRILIMGAGISGCSAANALAGRGFDVVLVEKSSQIGGKARFYGCKVVEKCQNCGVCLTSGLWNKVSQHKNIEIFTDSVVTDVNGKRGSFTVRIESQNESDEQTERFIENIDSIIISTGFENQTSLFSAHLHIDGIDESLSPNIITGTQLEQLMLNRSRTSLFEGMPSLVQEPRNVAFIQCLGSRDKNEGGLYCSKVCCSYATRAAKLIRSYYPECEITFFYMELQNVEFGNFYAGLKELGVQFVKCRPLVIKGEGDCQGDDSKGINPPDNICRKITISCQAPRRTDWNRPSDNLQKFDLVVLSDGIHAGVENSRIAEIYRLAQDKDGFLKTVDIGSGIFVCGTARAPMKIDEAHADAKAVAGRILEVENGKLRTINIYDSIDNRR